MEAKIPEREYSRRQLPSGHGPKETTNSMAQEISHRLNLQSLILFLKNPRWIPTLQPKD